MLSFSIISSCQFNFNHCSLNTHLVQRNNNIISTTIYTTPITTSCALLSYKMFVMQQTRSNFPPVIDFSSVKNLHTIIRYLFEIHKFQCIGKNISRSVIPLALSARCQTAQNTPLPHPPPFSFSLIEPLWFPYSSSLFVPNFKIIPFHVHVSG
jgi:hypothetical protein